MQADGHPFAVPSMWREAWRARVLYTSLGFQPCDPYRPIPKVFEPWTICMELPLKR